MASIVGCVVLGALTCAVASVASGIISSTGRYRAYKRQNKRLDRKFYLSTALDLGGGFVAPMRGLKAAKHARHVTRGSKAYGQLVGYGGYRSTVRQLVERPGWRRTLGLSRYGARVYFNGRSAASLR